MDPTSLCNLKMKQGFWVLFKITFFKIFIWSVNTIIGRSQGRRENSLVFATNLNPLIPIPLQADGENCLCLIFRLFNLTEFIGWDIKGLRHRVVKI